MKKGKGRNSVLWIESLGFLIIIALSWLVEYSRIPSAVFGDVSAPNLHRALSRTIIVLLIWAWVQFLTRRLLKRLHYLEEFLRICSWCRRVNEGDEWLELERYFKSKFATRTSHGMCPDCLKKKVEELALDDGSSTTKTGN